MHSVNQLPPQMQTIIAVANSLQRTGKSGASTGERIAAAFVLNKPQFLPAGYTDMIDAWQRLDANWQGYVLRIKRDYMHLIQAE